MGIFDFFKKKKEIDPIIEEPRKEPIDMSNWTGENFEFLIRGVDNILDDDYDNVMTPNSLEWNKVIKDDWPYYQIGKDEVCYSWEPPGIQMTFNKEISYKKAKKIADEVIVNLKAKGHRAELLTLESGTIYNF